MASAAITLTTDFGTADPYVAAMKAVILSTNPHAVIVDISHEVQPQRVEQAAFMLSTVLPYFPDGSIHIAVVDPGVGTQRRAIAIESRSVFFIGPDNGVLSPALPDAARETAGNAGGTVLLPEGTTAFELTEPRFHLPPVSATFHGRDVFASVAAHLSLGVPPTEFGPQIDSVVALPPLIGDTLPDGTVRGHVVHIDGFGNVIITVRADQAPEATVLEIGGRTIAGLARTYDDVEDIGAVIGSAGFIEIAKRNGNAALDLHISIGDSVLVRRAQGTTTTGN